MHQRFFAIHPFGLALACRIEQQDGVLGDQTHQHDDADKTHQVERTARQQQRQHHTDQRQRQRQHHRQRRSERAELHHQNQIHQANARQQRNQHLGEKFFLVLPGTTQREPVAWRIVERLGQFHGVVGNLAVGATLRIGRHRDIAFAIGVLNARRSQAHADGGNLVQRHHQVGTRNGNRQALDVFLADAVIGVQTHGHIACLAGGVDPISHFDAGKSDTQGLRCIRGRNPHRIGQAPVELDLQLLLGVLLGQADVHCTRHQAELVHVVTGDLQQLA